MTSSSEVLTAFRPARLGLAAEAEEVRAAAQATGYAAGWAEGRRAAAAQAEQERQRMELEDARIRQALRSRADSAITAAVEDWNRRSVPMLDELADTVVDAAIELAEAILGRELSAIAKPEVARLALRRALAPLTPGGPVTVRMNPADLQAISATTQSGMADGHTVQLVADDTLSPGDAVAEQEGATVDARIAAALDRARAVARG